MKDKLYQLIQEEQEAGLGPFSVGQGMVELAYAPTEVGTGARTSEGTEIGGFVPGSAGVPLRARGLSPGSGGMGAIRRAEAELKK